MGLAKNAITTVLVTGLLIGSLVFLFPSAAAAPAAVMGNGDISSVKCASSTAGAAPQCNGQSVVVKVDFKDMPISTLPAGATLQAKADAFALQMSIAIANAQGTCSSPITVDAGDAADTALDVVSAVPRVIIAGSSGGAGGAYYGPSGYEDVVGVTVRVKVNGCTFFTAQTPNPLSIDFTATNGALATPTVSRALVNPLAVLFQDSKPPAGGQPPESTTTTPKGKTVQLQTPSCTAPCTAGDPIKPTGQTLATQTVGPVKVTPKLRDQTTDPSAPKVRAGTEILIEQDPKSAGSKGAPSFGIAPAALNDDTEQDPIGYLLIQVYDPVDGLLADAGAVLGEVTATMCATAKEMRDAGMTTTATMRLVAFKDDGTKKPANQQPSTIGGTVTINGASVADDAALAGVTDGHQVCADFKITHFSPFALVAAKVTPPTSGGTCGSACPTTPPTTPGTTPADTDADGLPDTWETLYFGGLSATAAGDDDGDGLTNKEEHTAGTNPVSRDTDGDGISDGDEIANGTNPTDANSPAPATTPATPATPPSTPPSEPGKETSEPETPGFELVALVAALGAALIVARRR